MPWSSSTFGIVAQSLHATRCFRLESGAGMLGSCWASAASWLSKYASSCSGVQSESFEFGCRPISKPAAVRLAACASEMFVPG